MDSRLNRIKTVRDSLQNIGSQISTVIVTILLPKPNPFLLELHVIATPKVTRMEFVLIYCCHIYIIIYIIYMCI